MNEPVRLVVRDLTKRFGGLVAVRNLSFFIRGGEILGLIGPNGSGKSTVIKLIMGIERPDAGSVQLDGVEISRWPSHRISRAGIGIVFQRSRPLRRQTVVENIKLALLPDSLRHLVVDPNVDSKAREIADRVGLGDVMTRNPSALSYGDLRRLELAKAIARHPKVVLLDEPFAGLTSAEVASLSELILGFREEGRAVLLVDHHVKSVANLVDRVLAIYLGENIAEGTSENVLTNDNVKRVYLGGEPEEAGRRIEVANENSTLLRVDKVSVHYDKAQALDGVSLQVRKGEFVSIVGLNGAGKTTLFNAISGLVPFAGTIQFHDRGLSGMTAAAIARRGVVQCPETRELFLDMTVRENLDLGGHHLPSASRARQLAWIFELFPVLRSRQTQMTRTLSGGEQQMMAIARALMMQPTLLMLDEPTLGLAPVVLEELSSALEQLRKAAGMTVLLSEQNITFALPHADRIYLLERGRVVWEGGSRMFIHEMGSTYYHDPTVSRCSRTPEPRGAY